MKNSMKALVFAMGVLFFHGAWAAGSAFNKRVDLNDQCHLHVHEDGGGAVIVGLRCEGRGRNPMTTAYSVKIGNAGIDEEGFQKVTLDGNVAAYFITAWDRSSSFGAQTNVVVWKSNKQWRMVKAPFTRGFAEDRDKDGIVELVDYYPDESVYRFKDGAFIKVSTKESKAL